jgi:predicted  nucleic acid-binding Zn-ribbon protein
MKLLSLAYRKVPSILFVLFLLLSQTTFAQTVADLTEEIENHEQQMTILERQITRNNTASNSSANAALEQKIEEHANKITGLLVQIKQIKSGGSNNSNELELVALQKELLVMEDIVEDLEKEIGGLNKEIQRLTAQNGGSIEIEKLQNKVAKLQSENQILKQQINGYRKNSNPSPNSGNSTKVTRLEGQVKMLKTKNQQLQVQINNVGTRNLLHDKHFLKQYRSINTTNFVLGYRYTMLPTINFNTKPSLLQGSKKVGTILPIADLSASGHYGFMGVEFLLHGRHVGGNWGLTANYAYNEGIDIKMQTTYFQLSGELTILPIRLGIKVGGNLGYTFGQIRNHSALLNDNSIQVDPEFSTLMVGFDTKLRLYLSRFIAFTGYFGADYALSDQFKTDSWNTMFRYGVGIDFIIPLKKM